MGDQRRSSWPWRKLKLPSSSPSKARDKSSPSQLTPPAPSIKADESATRFFESPWKQKASCSSVMEDGNIGEANALRDQAEESLKALKQELGTLMKELSAKEALVKQHQKVADEAVSGWEKSEKEVLSLKQELDAASKRRVILEDHIAHLDGALKECMRQVRNVRDEQEVKIQEVINYKTRELEEVKAEMEAKQADLERRLMESDAQSSVMAKSLQERAWKILEANEAKSKTEAELKIMQVKLGSAEKDISSLQYELHLLSKELEIRNEEVVFCKKSADVAHKQHLDNVHKLAKLEADCQRLRILLKKKLPGPAAIAQMRKEVEGLSTKESTAHMHVDGDFKRRPAGRSYASTTISFANSHQKGMSSNSINRSNGEMLRDRLVSMEEENKLLKEALSKRMGELQTSRLLCAKTVNKLSIAEDYLESLQGTPRNHAKTDRSFDFDFTASETRSVASLSDAEEASCAESWASALIGELAHFKRDKTITKEAIMEVTEPNKTRVDESTHDAHHVVDVKHVVQHEEKCPCVNGTLPEPRKLPLQCQHEQVNAMSLLCKELNHQLGIIQEAIRVSNAAEKVELIGLVDAAQKTFSALDKEIQQLIKTSLVQLLSSKDVVGNMAGTIPITISERDDSGLHVGIPRVPTMMTENAIASATLQTKGLNPSASVCGKTLNCEDGSKMDANLFVSAVKSCEPNGENKHEYTCSSTLGSVLSKLIALLERMPRRSEDATFEADCADWEQEKQELKNYRDRLLQGKESVSEILVRIAMLVCRACHVGSHELEHMLASLANTDMGRVNAYESLSTLPREPQKDGKLHELDDGVAEKPHEPDTVSEVAVHVALDDELEATLVDEADADMAANKCHEELDCHDEVDASMAAGRYALIATLEKPHGKHADEAASHAELELAVNVAPVDRLGTDLASKLARLQSEQERLCEERDKLLSCERGAMKLDAELHEAQAQLSRYKMLHSQLQTQNEELQLKLQG